MMQKNPKITIVTPIYNGEEYIEKCIQSLMHQEYENFEHIIVDGGSTDQTIEIIKGYQGKYPMKWISEPDEGMYDAINKGFKMASGEIFAWLNADDFYFPWTLSVVAKVFEKEQIEWLTGIPSNTKIYDNVSVTYQLPNLPPVYCTPLIKMGAYDGVRISFVQQESCFWTKALWEICGGIDSSYKMAGDYFLWKSFAKHARLYSVQCNLASFRIHRGQKSSDLNQYHHEIGKNRNTHPFSMIYQIYAIIYSLVRYRKYVVNLDDLYGDKGK